MSYGIKTDYYAGIAVVPADLNRRGDVLQAQLPGAFRALGPGVLGEDDLLVTIEIAAGRAIVEGADGVLVYVEVPDALPIPAGDENYLFLALRVPEFVGGPGDTRGTSSQRGAPPVARLSDDPDEPDALLLSTRVDGIWTDSRPKSRLVQLEAEVTELSARLDDLDEPASGEGGPTTAQFNAFKVSFEAYKTEVNGRLDALEAAQALADTKNDLFPAPFDLLADEIAINRAGLAEVNPHAIERGQISVIVSGAGHGQNDTPDYSPDTGSPLELPLDNQGVMSP